MAWQRIEASTLDMCALRFCSIRLRQIAVFDRHFYDLFSCLPTDHIPKLMCSKKLRSGERDGYGRTVPLLACKSAIDVRAE